ncbi:MAG: hypothetical protein RLY87_374 [Chloroflexota bacterium]|jgi:hypothetical protein
MTTPASITCRYSMSDGLAAATLYQSSTLKHRVYQIVALGIFSFTLYQAYRIGFQSSQLLLYVIAILLFIDPVPLILMSVTRLSQPAWPTTLTFDSTGIVVSVNDRSTTYPWAKFNKLIENQRYILLVHASWGYLVIPTAVLKASGHEQAVRSLIAASVRMTP